MWVTLVKICNIVKYFKAKWKFCNWWWKIDKCEFFRLKNIDMSWLIENLQTKEAKNQQKKYIRGVKFTLMGFIVKTKNLRS